MAYYLSDFQSVVDFSLKDASKFNEKLLRELKVHFTKLAALFAPDLVGASRPNYKPTSSEDDPVYTQNKDYLIHMAEATSYGTQTVNRAYYNIGYNSGVGTTYTNLDEGYSTEPVTAQKVYVVSSSANDTASGSGVQLVLLQGLDSSYYRIGEQVTLNGTTPVASTNQFTYIDKLQAEAVGANLFAVGNISATNSGGGTTYGRITAGENAWRPGKFYVPANQTGYVDAWLFGASNNGTSNASRAQLLANRSSEGFPYPALVLRATAISATESVFTAFPGPIMVAQVRG